MFAPPAFSDHLTRKWQNKKVNTLRFPLPTSLTLCHCAWLTTKLARDLARPCKSCYLTVNAHNTPSDICTYRPYKISTCDSTPTSVAICQRLLLLAHEAHASSIPRSEPVRYLHGWSCT